MKKKISIVILTLLSFPLIFQLSSVLQVKFFPKTSTAYAQDNNWLDPLMSKVKSTNLGEFTDNRTWYFPDSSGAPILIPSNGISVQTVSPGAQSRTIQRYVGTTVYNRQPVTVTEHFVSLGPSDPAMQIPLNNLSPSLYTLNLYGTIAAKGRTQLERVWKPLPLEFHLYDAQGNELERGLLLSKQGFSPRRMQAFHFHIPQAGNYTVTIKAPNTAQETAEIMWFVLLDHMDGIPDEAIKSSQNLEQGLDPQNATLDTARLNKDEMIWKALPPLNNHIYLSDMIPQFTNAPLSAGFDTWINKPWEGVDPWNIPTGPAFGPLEFKNTTTGETFSYNQIINHAPLPGAYNDDGTGKYLLQSDFPNELETNVYYNHRARLLGQRYGYFYSSLVSQDGNFRVGSYARNCRDTGDTSTCHDAAIALVRWAYDWPALEMSVHDLQFSTHTPDLTYNVDWTTRGRRNGKFLYSGWSGTHQIELMRAYDELFPYIEGNQALADSLQRFVPWIQTPDDVIKLLDRYLVLAGVRDFNWDTIRGQPVELMAAQVLGPHPQTIRLFDMTKSQETIQTATDRYSVLFSKVIRKSGAHNGSYLVYDTGLAADVLERAALSLKFIQQGVTPLFNLSDTDKYPKVQASLDLLIDMFVAGGYPVIAGDAGGSTHTPREAENRFKLWKSAFYDGFFVLKDPRAAWIIKNIFNDSDPAISEAASKISRAPHLHSESRVVPGEFAVIERGTDETDFTKKTAVIMKLGVGNWHAHEDYLDLNLYGFGLPMAVDLGQRNEGNNWTRPAAKSASLHNHAYAHTDLNSQDSGPQTGEVELTGFGENLMRARYVDNTGLLQTDRDVVVVDVMGTDNSYVVDLQKVRGGSFHTWAFHGAESNSTDGFQLKDGDTGQALSTSDANNHGWFGAGSTRFLPVTSVPRLIATAPEKLEATWTLSREDLSFTHEFNGGGTVTQKASEQIILGSDYDSNKPPARITATLLGQNGSEVLRANPYSELYKYAFPFLWVQSPAKSESVYPAVYQMYRGDTPLLSNIEKINDSPLTLEITTQTGQVDTITFNNQTITVVSRDGNGDLLWAKLAGGQELNQQGLSVTATRGTYVTTVEDIDYNARTLKTKDPLPVNPKIIVGNEFRKIYLQLYGQGLNFTFNDDLLVNDDDITAFRTVNDTTVDIDAGSPMFVNNNAVGGDKSGNRKPQGFTWTNEDGSLHWRASTVIKKPAGTVTQDVFSDANGDTFTSAKTYEFGIGDSIEVPTDITIKKTTNGAYEVLTNIPITTTINGSSYSFNSNDGWQSTGSTAKPGDTDGDGDVDIFDYNTVISNFGQNVTGPKNGDLDNDGDVDIFDYNLVISNFGT